MTITEAKHAISIALEDLDYQGISVQQVDIEWEHSEYGEFKNDGTTAPPKSTCTVKLIAEV
jgi:hypothetical protein